MLRRFGAFFLFVCNTPVFPPKKSYDEKWRYDYNFYHPHKALEYKAPYQYASRYSKDLDPWKEEEIENIVKFIPV